MKKLFTFLLLLSTLILNAQTYTITFNLIDYYNSKPVEGAAVVCDGQSKYSDATGTAVFVVPIKANAISKYYYNIQKPGWISVHDSLSIKSNKTVTVLMKPIVFMIVFQVSDGVNPMQGVYINFDNRSLQVDSSSGTAVFSLVRMADSMEYQITKTGYKDVVGFIPVTQNTSRLFYMTKINTDIVTFYVEGSHDSIPIKDSKVVFNNDTIITSELGKAMFTNVPIGIQLYKAYKENLESETSTINRWPSHRI